MPRSRRSQRGGGAGGGWGFAPASVHTINNELAFDPIGNCRGTPDRPGLLSGVVPSGLPGMKGGRRGRKGSRKSRKSRKVQRGGRYGFLGPDPLVNGSPGNSSYAAVGGVGCEASRSAIPSSHAAGSLNVRGGELWSGQGGGAQAVAPADFQGSAQLGDPSITIPTARYTQLAGANSSFETAAGTNVMINAPVGGAEMNPACLKTGGGKRSRKNRRKQRKNRKNRSCRR